MQKPLIIGAGHNGLVAAFYLARAGHRPVVLERRASVGGGAATDEIAPGVLCPTLAHATGPLRPEIVRDMALARRVEFLAADPRLVALSPDGRALVFSGDARRTAEAIRTFSTPDAEAYAGFCASLERLGSLLLPLLDRTPPSIDAPSAADLWELLKVARRWRALGRTDAYRLLRWMPMPVADLVAEVFSSDLLRASIAARALTGSAAAPSYAGTGARLLMNAAFDPAPGGSSVTVKGGPGALTRAMADAAVEAGAVIRLDSPVARILVRKRQVAGVLLADGSELPGDTIVSNADPKRTLLDLVDPVELDPGFLQRIRNYRMAGTLAKVNLVLSGLPGFLGLEGEGQLMGRIQIGPTLEYLERAFDASKYGQMSAEPYLEAMVPSLLDPSLCPPGRHVMSIYVQFVPYALARSMDPHALRDQIAGHAIRALERYAPDLRNLIEEQQVLTPRDLDERYGFTEGHILHGEPSLDQLFTMRPVLGWAQYRMPIGGLFLCGGGTHPGGGLTGAPGRNAAREIIRLLQGRTAPRASAEVQ